MRVDDSKPSSEGLNQIKLTTMEKLIRTGILLGLVMFSIVGVIALLTEEFKTEQVVFMLTMVVGSLVIGKLMIEEGEL
jgi:hypothetical protein